jgi:hypothetical protein
MRDTMKSMSTLPLQHGDKCVVQTQVNYLNRSEVYKKILNIEGLFDLQDRKSGGIGKIKDCYDLPP